MVAWTQVALEQILRWRRPDVDVDPAATYQFAGVYSFGRGVFLGPIRTGSEFSYRRLTRVREGEFVYPKLMAWEGAFGLVPPGCDGAYVSPEFPVFEIDRDRLVPRFLALYFRTPGVWETISGGSIGTNVRRRRLHPRDFLERTIPLPPLAEQHRLVSLQGELESVQCLQAEIARELDALMSAILSRAFTLSGPKES